MTTPHLLLFVLAATALPAHAAAPPRKPRLPEGLRMLVDILADRPTAPGSGWFGPSLSAYGWDWLAARFDADRDGVITPKEFPGPRELFRRLDRDGDRKLTRADFDWSPRSPIVQRERLADMLFRRADRNLNGRITADEWQELFQQAAGKKGSLTPEDLRQILFPPPALPPSATAKKSPEQQGPSRWTMLRGFLTGEIGSFCEGPALGEEAPAFTLHTHDGKRVISLADYRDKRPVVLIFGSFT
jgi:hypothetical protein